MKKSIIFAFILLCTILTASKTEAINYKKAAYGIGATISGVGMLGSLLLTEAAIGLVAVINVELFAFKSLKTFLDNPDVGSVLIKGSTSTLGFYVLTKILYDKYEQESKK